MTLMIENPKFEPMFQQLRKAVWNQATIEGRIFLAMSDDTDQLVSTDLEIEGFINEKSGGFDVSIWDMQITNGFQGSGPWFAGVGLPLHGVNIETGDTTNFIAVAGMERFMTRTSCLMLSDEDDPQPSHWESLPISEPLISLMPVLRRLVVHQG